MNTVNRVIPHSHSIDYHELAAQVIQGEGLDRRKALAILESSDAQLPELLAGAFRIRHHYFGMKVKCCMLINAKSGMCSEDCAYCSQSAISKANIQRYDFVNEDEIVACALKHKQNKSYNFSIVTSGKGPSELVIRKVCNAIRRIKAEAPGLEVCASLGILQPGQAQRLKEAGLDRYHHNINTSPQHHANIVHTHTFEDRLRTVREVKAAGLSSCSGVIVGMGERLDDVVDMAFILRELDVDSIPVNFLFPVEGTPLAERKPLPATFCLKTLAMFRYVCPRQELRVAGGRELNLRSLQPLSLYPANAIFVGDYLTLKGNQVQDDIRMIEDMGFVIEYSKEYGTT